jgi:hypothetical protein
MKKRAVWLWLAGVRIREHGERKGRGWEARLGYKIMIWASGVW